MTDERRRAVVSQVLGRAISKGEFAWLSELKSYDAWVEQDARFQDFVTDCQEYFDRLDEEAGRASRAMRGTNRRPARKDLSETDKLSRRALAVLAARAMPVPPLVAAVRSHLPRLTVDRIDEWLREQIVAPRRGRRTEPRWACKLEGEVMDWVKNLVWSGLGIAESTDLEETVAVLTEERPPPTGFAEVHGDAFLMRLLFPTALDGMTLAYTGAGGETRHFFTKAHSVPLTLLNQVARVVADLNNLQPPDAVTWLLTGEIPAQAEMPAYEILAERNPLIPALSRVTMRLDPSLSPREVARLYQEHRGREKC